MLSAERVIEILNLRPLEMEGGWFRETYRSEEMMPSDALPSRYRSNKCFSTCIYYLLTPDSFSRLHRVAADEIFHFHLGDPVVILMLWPDGRSETVEIGPDLERGMRPQLVAPRGVWQGCHLREGGRFALLSCTVAPGFDYSDYESGAREELIGQYPDRRQLIEKLTPA